MTDEYLSQDIPWDKPDEIVDREPAQGEGRHHFGHLRLYGMTVKKSFTAGDHITIPGVKGGQFNEQDNKGDMLFKGWLPGKDQWLFILVATKKDKDLQDYQIVKQYPSKLQRKDDPHLWADFVMPALMKLTKVERDKMSAEGIYCEWDETPTGHVFEDSNGKKHDIKAWVNFKPHPDEASLKEASDEFFSQFSTSYYPADWGDTTEAVQAMITYGKEQDISNHAELAETLMLTKNGIVAKTSKGDDCNVTKILSEVLDIPEPMIKL